MGGGGEGTCRCSTGNERVLEVTEAFRAEELSPEHEPVEIVLDLSLCSDVVGALTFVL
jgi:hypothetical protein